MVVRTIVADGPGDARDTVRGSAPAAKGWGIAQARLIQPRAKRSWLASRAMIST